MEVRILVSIIIVNYFIFISESSAEEAQFETEETTVTDVGEHAETGDLAHVPVERSGHAHVHVDSTLKGFWAKKFAWRPRWVKTWQEKKVYVAVWKRMWGPVETKEWVPVPKPPPGWIKKNVASYIVKKFPHN